MNRLPKGLNTEIGQEFCGRELSDGEWQKLALARAFMRNCSLLVLDASTAVLDVQTELEVYLRFNKLTRDRTTKPIIIDSQHYAWPTEFYIWLGVHK